MLRSADSDGLLDFVHRMLSFVNGTRLWVLASLVMTCTGRAGLDWIYGYNM